MTFKEFAAWFHNLPWTLKWFPLLVILRPLIDNLYFLKNVSPLLSPPYIVGVASPLLAILALSTFKFPRFTPIDKAFFYWSVSVLLACLFLLFYDPFSLLTIEFVLKLALPVYLYFFMRLLIRDLRDLHGILQCFLYSGIFVAALLIFEVFVNPIAIEESRGLERIQASFGDVVSYGMYIIFTFIAAAYFYFSRQHRLKVSKRLLLLIPVMMLGVLGLVNIHHTATYTVFILVTLLFVVFNMRGSNRIVAFAILMAIGLALDFWGSEVVEERITPLVQTDLAVYAGEQDSDRLLHGRVGRWRLMLSKFSSEDVHIQFFGFPLKFKYAFQYIGIGSHNDFIRILFATGILGLLLYLHFLYRVIATYPKLGMAARFLLLSVIFALVFYSISVTPTVYAPFMYFALSVIAFLSLPLKQTQLWNGRAY